MTNLGLARRKSRLVIAMAVSACLPVWACGGSDPSSAASSASAAAGASAASSTTGTGGNPGECVMASCFHGDGRGNHYEGTGTHVGNPGGSGGSAGTAAYGGDGTSWGDGASWSDGGAGGLWGGGDGSGWSQQGGQGGVGGHGTGGIVGTGGGGFGPAGFGGGDGAGWSEGSNWGDGTGWSDGSNWGDGSGWAEGSGWGDGTGNVGGNWGGDGTGPGTCVPGSWALVGQSFDAFEGKHVYLRITQSSGPVSGQATISGGTFGIPFTSSSCGGDAHWFVDADGDGSCSPGDMTWRSGFAGSGLLSVTPTSPAPYGIGACDDYDGAIPSGTGGSGG